MEGNVKHGNPSAAQLIVKLLASPRPGWSVRWTKNGKWLGSCASDMISRGFAVQRKYSSASVKKVSGHGAFCRW